MVLCPIHLQFSNLLHISLLLLCMSAFVHVQKYSDVKNSIGDMVRLDGERNHAFVIIYRPDEQV